MTTLPVDLRTICEHEAAHAVMRQLVGMPATAVWATHTNGYCAGTGKPVSARADLLVTLAGFAWETKCGRIRLDLKRSKTGDFDAARALLEKAVHLRIVWDWPKQKKPTIESVEKALQRQFQCTCDYLSPFQDVVRELGWMLSTRRKLSARRVAAFFREWTKRKPRRRPHSQLRDTKTTRVRR